LLEAAARAKAEDMAAKSYFAHTSPEGRTPWYWLDLVGYKYAYAGENLAVDFDDSTDVTNAWMNSPGHRANIMSERYTEIGIATARGSFEGHPTVFVVQFFGRPVAKAPATGIARTTPVPAPKPATPKPTSTVHAAETAPANATSIVSTTAAAAPAPVVTTDVAGSSPVASAMANPVRSVNGLFVLLMLLVSVALAAKLYRVGLMHPRLIVNGLVVLIVLGAFVALNGQAFLANARVF
jgi:hypothetical protein